MTSTRPQHDHSSSPLLSSLSKYETLRSAAWNKNDVEAEINGNIHRVGNLDILYDDEAGEEIALCHLINMNWHSRRNENGKLIPIYPGYDYHFEIMAAMALAIDHLNTGDGRVVEEVKGLNERCNIRFTAEFWNTQGQEIIAVDQVIAAMDRDPSRDNEPLPCAFVGSFLSGVSSATSMLTGMKGYPQISPTSESAKLDDKDRYPLFGRTIPSAENNGGPTLDYLYNELGVEYLAVVYSDSEYSLSVQAGIVAAAELYPEIHIKTFGFPALADETDYEAVVGLLKGTGYRFIFVSVSVNQFIPLMEAAYKHEIAGTGHHNWISSNTAIATSLLDGKVFTPDSPLFKSATGFIMIFIVTMPGTGRYDAYLKEWQQIGQSPEALKYLQSKVPKDPTDPTYDPKITPSVFDETKIQTPWAYDATILLGLAACETTKGEYPDGTAHYNAVLNTTFVGASGTVDLDPSTGNRKGESSVIAVLNTRPRKINNSSNFTFETVRTDYYDGQWFKLEPLTFNDGTATHPLDLPELKINYNYIGSGLRSIGLSMSAVVLVLSVGLAFWTQTNCNQRVIRASQPFFLHLICIGTFLMGSSIILLSIDDEVATHKSCDLACLSYPWFLSIGWVFAFSALFTKTRRIVKVFHNPKFRRITVTASDVMKPMLVLLVANVFALSLMTSLTPSRWVRGDLDYDDYGRVDESSGYCEFDGKAVSFVVALLAIDLGTLMFAGYQAYVARNISTEFAESESIAKAMACILVVSFVGIPVVYIAEDDRKSFFFVLSGIIFVICMSLLLFIFVPKIVEHRNKDKISTRESIESSLQFRPSGGTQSATASADSFKPEDCPPDEIPAGAEVIEHPKIKEDLKAKVIVLEERVAELEGMRRRALKLNDEH